MKKIFAILGAESTGKTTLAGGLAEALRADGHAVARVDEYLREFCGRHGRTPLQHEQAGIAHEQARRIEEAASTHDIVIADTTAMMIAVYSDLVFDDPSLYAWAEAQQHRIHLTLMTALDLPWQPDGLQRDGPHVREPVAERVRASLQRAASPYAVVQGAGPARLACALAAVKRELHPPEAGPGPRWQWVCGHCDDGSCERHLLPRT